MAGMSPQEQNAEIIERLDVAAEYTALGLKISGTPRDSGMVSCYAFGRDDRRPSAWINIKTGFYGDSGGKDSAACTHSLWDFAVLAGKFSDWKEARKAYADKAGIKLGRKTQVVKWRDKLEFQPWDTPGNDVLVMRWCTKVKPGITPEAIKAAGGRIAYYPCWIDKKTKEKKRTKNCRQVIALPCYGQWGLAADPVAWVIMDITGRPFDVTPKDWPADEPRRTSDKLSVGLTAGTTMGLSGLMTLSDKEQRGKIEWVWKTAGPTDLLQFLSIWPPEGIGTAHVPICNAGGESADVPVHQAALLAGLKVAVVGDRDETGVLGAEKWGRALDGISEETRLIELPYPLVKSHGKDIRNYLTEKPRPLGDLITLLDQAKPWEPPTEAEPNRPNDKDLDLGTDLAIARALQIDVLGRLENDQIKVYSEHLARTVVFGGLGRMRYEDMLLYFGTPVRKAVSKTDDDGVPGMYPIHAVREALAHLASEKLIGAETELGPGCWTAEEGQPDSGVVLVNAGEAMFYHVERIERITHPRFRDRLLSFDANEGRPWFAHETLSQMLKEAENDRWRKDVVDDLCKLFQRWRWRGKSDSMIVSGLVLATWIQTHWAWRPRVDLLGSSKTGKSMLCAALHSLFSGCCILTSDTTAAGLRQEIKNSAVAVIVDEIDSKNAAAMTEQKKILKMLRSASRGTAALRGTGGGQKGIKFTLRHLVWVAGIAIQNNDTADKNRSITLNLEKPQADMAGKLILPSTDELRTLGQRALAAAVWAADAAVDLAVRLKSEKAPGVDSRLVESYAVPTAILATVLGLNYDHATQMLAQMLQEAATEGEVESDEEVLIGEILGATRRLGPTNYTVGQMVEFIKNSPPDRDTIAFERELATVGIKVENDKIIFLYRPVRKLFPRDSDWAGQPIEQYLRRIDGHAQTRRRVGGSNSRGVMFDLDWFYERFMHDQNAPTAKDEGF